MVIKYAVSAFLLLAWAWGCIVEDMILHKMGAAERERVGDNVARAIFITVSVFLIVSIILRTWGLI